MRKLLFVLFLFASLGFSQITLVNKNFGQTDWLGANDSAAGTWTSKTIPLSELHSQAGGKFRGLITVALNYDSLVANCADDSFMVYVDLETAGDWIPTDTLAFNISTLADAVAFTSTTTTIITVANKASYMVSYINPTPAATTPTSRTHLGYSAIRARIVKVKNINGKIRLDIIPD